MTTKDLERLHLLATLRTYQAADALFIRERANDEAAHEAFDPIPFIEPRQIAQKLTALRKRGLVNDDEDGIWRLTPRGDMELRRGLAELDGHVEPGMAPTLDDECNAAWAEVHKARADADELRELLRELLAAGRALVPHVGPIDAAVSVRWDEAMGAAADALARKRTA